jgi:MFS family permease
MNEAFEKRERRVLVVTCYGHFMSHFNMLVFPALALPLAGRMDLSLADVLGLSFWMYLLFGLMALPWGLAADRWASPPLLLLFYLGSGIAGLAAALWIDSPQALSLALALLGIASAIYHPAGLGMISMEVRNVSMGMGYNGMFGNLGLFAAPLAAGFLNWRWGPGSVYLVLAGLNLLGALLMLSFPLAGKRAAKPETSGKDGAMLVPFLILLVAMMLGGICYRGATVTLPACFELRTPEIYRWVSSVTGKVLSGNLIATVTASLIYLVGMAGQYTGGRAAERFDPRRCYLAFYVMTVPAAFLMAAATDLPLVLLATVYFFFLLGMQPVENTLVTRFTPERVRHSAFGLKFVLTFGVGALAVKMVEFLEKRSGIETVFTALGGISVALVGVILVLIVRTRDRGSPQQVQPSPRVDR